jgi:integral membrane sensor domain MASE1/anti-sigma regulatory factor (Ser/Thr protein kinase)
MVAIGVAYAAGSLLAYWLFGASDIGVAYFPPAGVSAAALVMLPRRAWPWALVAIVSAEVLVDLGQGHPVGLSLGFALANGLEPLVGVSLLRLWTDQVDLRRPGDLTRFCLTVVVAGPLVGGLVGATVLSLSGPSDFVSDALHWWVGDGLGVLTIGAPAVVLSRRGATADLRPPLEPVLLLALVTGASVLMFWRWEEPFAFLLSPLLLAAAFRYGVSGVALGGAAAAFMANVATATGRGPYAAMDSLSAQEQLGMTQLVLAVLILTSWYFAAEIHERDQAMALQHRAELVALENARLYSESRDVALRLQRSLLADSIAEVWDATAAARYEPGVQDLEVGGDWFDTIRLPGGRLGLAVGDVVGRGLEAAATMGRLRTALAALAADGDPPGVVLERLHHFTRRVPGADCASCCYAVLHPTTGDLEHASAGHPPILVRRADGSTDFLPDGRSSLLGLSSGARPTARHRLAPGDAVILYSDGLVERRGEHLDEGLARLAAVVGAVPGGVPDLVCDAALARLAPPAGLHDDAVILCARREVSAVGALRLRFPAAPAALADVRRTLRAWMEEAEVPAGYRDPLLVATGEACTNAVEHAYLSEAGEVDLCIEREGARVEITVRDDGRWRPVHLSTNRGRGTLLMRELSHGFAQQTDQRGTAVRLVYDLEQAVP